MARRAARSSLAAPARPCAVMAVCIYGLCTYGSFSYCQESCKVVIRRSCEDVAVELNGSGAKKVGGGRWLRSQVAVRHMSNVATCRPLPPPPPTTTQTATTVVVTSDIATCHPPTTTTAAATTATTTTTAAATSDVATCRPHLLAIHRAAVVSRIERRVHRRVQVLRLVPRLHTSACMHARGRYDQPAYTPARPPARA